MRLYASSLSLNRDRTRSENNSGEGRDLTIEDPSYFGQLKPYALYIPTAAAETETPLPPALGVSFQRPGALAI